MCWAELAHPTNFSFIRRVILHAGQVDRRAAASPASEGIAALAGVTDLLPLLEAADEVCGS